jgi:hypothetical protein
MHIPHFNLLRVLSTSFIRILVVIILVVEAEMMMSSSFGDAHFNKLMAGNRGEITCEGDLAGRGEIT